MDTTTVAIRHANSDGRDRVGIAGDQAGLLSGDKLLAVVEVLMRATDALAARAIADATGINRSTTHRALNTLINRGWVDRTPDGGGYRLSVKFLALVHVSTHERSFLREIRPALDLLSERSRETVHVGVLDGFEVLHVDKIDSLERVGVSSKIGSRGPAHTASLGKALLAASPDELVERYLRHTRAGAAGAPFDEASFRAELALTRARGYSLDNEEDAVGVRCLGVAVRGAGGAPLFALSLTGPSGRFTIERALELAPLMVATAADLSRRLGAELASETS